ncbi:hypothetical protein NX794_25720 [Streptomyces sp. LP11]|uniref:Uncharacterized protein n=1 Tax=Streptomyces pyxinicus TaxID=2970331 RepID=A0ABT2B7U0_9ACTN|nr:hypothetical protein [Streptomyces sp. LP11]MCS0604589.1 hypothetical protein [Streptomyces sp. LP11]
MRETPDTGRKRIDLSVPQVAGSALAAVVAAKLASYFGVYGTIVGAGVVSVVATCGGTVFQHFFKHTGEQLREKATVTARPREQVGPAPGEFSAGTVYRARVRSWRRPLIGAALVFAVTMAGVTTYELVSGNSFSGGGGTTVGDAVTGRGSSSSKPGGTTPSSPASEPSGSSPSGGSAGSEGETGPTGSGGGGDSRTASPTPSGSPDPGAGDGATTPSPAPTPSGSAGTPTPPAPSASRGSETAAPDQDGPATP